MEPAILISALALGLSAIGFFYKLGRDTQGDRGRDNGESKLDQIYRSTEVINQKLDDIAEWQREAAQIHTSHEERIKTLFSDNRRLDDRMAMIEKRLEDREVLNKSLQKILERLG